MLNLVDLLVILKQLRVEFQDAVLEAHGGLSTLGAAIDDLVEGIHPLDIGADEVVLPLQPVIDKILKLFHLDLDNYLVDILAAGSSC